MNRSRVTHASIHLDGPPEGLQLDVRDLASGVIVLRIDGAADLILTASEATLRHAARLLEQAADIKNARTLREVA